MFAAGGARDRVHSRELERNRMPEQSLETRSQADPVRRCRAGRHINELDRLELRLANLKLPGRDVPQHARSRDGALPDTLAMDIDQRVTAPALDPPQSSESHAGGAGGLRG